MGVFDTISEFMFEATVAVTGTGWVTGSRELVASALERKCLVDANASQTVKQIDAMTEDIAKNWHPSSYYSPEQVVQVVQLIMPYLSNARAIATAAPLTTSDAVGLKRQMIANIDRKMADVKRYTDGAAQAMRGGFEVVQAESLRTWVAHALVDVSQGYVFAAIQQCQRTTLDDAYDAVMYIGKVLKTIGETLLKLGQKILELPGKFKDAWTYVKWGAAIFGGYVVYREVNQLRSGGHAPNPSRSRARRRKRLR